MLSSPSENILRLWWEKPPKIARRFSDLAAACLLDGVYLSSWPWLGTLLPPAVFLLGFWLGWKHPGFERAITYTFSLPLMGVMLAIGSMGAALGCWLESGYILGDFFLFQHSSSNSPVITVLIIRLSLILSYVLLAQLIIFIPLISQSLRQATLPRLRVGSENIPIVALPLEAALQACLQGFLVFLWVNAIPTLIRPLFTWRGAQPPTEAIMPLQINGHVLIVLAILLAIGRVFLEDRAAKTDKADRASSIAETVASTVPNQIQLPPLIAAIVHALFLTFMLSGITSSGVQAFYLSIVLFFIFITRRFLSTLVPFWPRLMNKIPILLRLVAAGGLNFWIAGKLIQQNWNNSGNTFFPILLSTGVGILLFSLFLPRTVNAHPPNSSRKQTDSPLSQTEHLLLLAVGTTALITGLEQPAVADNCGSITDCYYVIRNAIIAGGAIAIAVSLTLDLLPIISDIKGIIEGIRGRDSITGERLAGWQRFLGAIPVFGRLPDVARAITKVADEAVNAAKVTAEAAKVAKAAAAAGDTAKATEAAKTAAKAAEKAAEAAKSVGGLGKAAKASDATRAADAASNAARAAEEANSAARAAEGTRAAEKANNTVRTSEATRDASRAMDRPARVADGIAVADANEILSLPKGQRPNPEEYLSKIYIENHLAKFDEGASFLVPREVLDRYGRESLGFPDNSQFVMPKSEMDDLINSARGNISVLEERLGLPKNSLDGKELRRINISNPRELNLRMPSGNEMGANEFWLPGGKLPNGQSEAIIDRIPSSKYSEESIQ